MEKSLIVKKKSIDPIPLFIEKYQFISFHTFPLDTLY